jgi:general secretion pathway protein I
MEAYVSARNRSREQGFTLIELLVAMAVFSLAAMALLRLEGATIRTSADVQTRTYGQIVAGNLAAELLSDPGPPSLGRVAGEVNNAGRQWRWVRQAKRTDDPRIVRIDIRVTDNAGRPAGQLSLAKRVG